MTKGKVFNRTVHFHNKLIIYTIIHHYPLTGTGCESVSVYLSPAICIIFHLTKLTVALGLTKFKTLLLIMQVKSDFIQHASIFTDDIIIVIHARH